MDRQEALEHLQEGNYLSVGSWNVWMSSNETIYMGCGDEGCCEDYYESFDLFWESYGHNQEEMYAY